MFPTNGMFQQGALPSLEKGVAFAEARQRVIANNIANAETKGYQSRDLDVNRFQSRLQEARFNRRWGNPRVFDFRDDASFSDAQGFLQSRVETDRSGLMRHSKNNVDIDRENAKMAKNALYHSTLANLLSQQMNQLRSAIRGTV